MPKKQNPQSQSEQSERFKREAQKLIDAGELNPTDADKALDNLVRKGATTPPTADRDDSEI